MAQTTPFSLISGSKQRIYSIRLSTGCSRNRNRSQYRNRTSIVSMIRNRESKGQLSKGERGSMKGINNGGGRLGRA